MTVNADLSPERKIYSTTGHAINLYAELIKNMSTRAKPDGNALSSVVEKFITYAISESTQSGASVSSIIQKKLHSFTEAMINSTVCQNLCKYLTD